MVHILFRPGRAALVKVEVSREQNPNGLELIRNYFLNSVVRRILSVFLVIEAQP